ncbi:MAG: dTDP-4-dehydrorhamnose reductase [Candidatus Moranbacteria bacterium]|nr:dTDP-4-dehydrorhamnose reductase [Candidatus Moranbacteria bacterium]MDD3964799.1 dTDP-4-dehydrorhamnose reductase [Candidatus Moranbacteria bacterium]
MMTTKVLILGAKGMLGQELVDVFSQDEKYTVTSWDFEDIDVTDFVSAEEKIRSFASDIIVNAVAYNAVDKCEESDEEYEKAMMLNALVPKFLAHLAQTLDNIFVHYSTDYVFDGTNQSGYAENALPQPLSRYGMSKRMGEENVLAVDGKNYIIRLSKLFGKPAISTIAKKSFFDVMLQIAKTKERVQAVDDEKSCFTYAPDLAQETKALLEDRAPWGIYHLPNSDDVTWYEAVQELYTQAKIGVTIQPVGSDAFPRPARRPQYSKLLNTKRVPLRSYKEALQAYLAHME